MILFLIGAIAGTSLGLVLGGLLGHTKRAELYAEIQRLEIRQEILESVALHRPNIKMAGHLVQPPRWEETRN